MDLDHDICYRAIESRDARFDGRFFTAVRTTGIYCRPICPATTPRRRNVVFYACAAAAEQAGFRACKRCRPETSPGTPAWSGTSTTVSRALRCIAEGSLDHGGVNELARRLGIGPRQLSRLFAQHLGATPVQIAQSRRVHFARGLMEQSSLPMTQIAFAAGFGSLRRFNTLMRAAYGVAPGALRRDGAADGNDGAMGGHDALACRLPYRPPYDWTQLACFLRGRAIPGVEHVDEGCYQRTIRVGDESGIFSVKPGDGNWLQLRLEMRDLKGAIGIVARIRHMFDCGADPQVIADHLAQDPLLRSRVERRPGLRLPAAFDPFELAVRAILGQQVSVAAATTIAGRLVARCGFPLSCPRGPLTHLFPTPPIVAAADLSGLGLTATRVRTLKTFAAAVADGALQLEAPRGADAFAERFEALPGIGPWTAQYVAMRAFGEPDAFPASDLGLRHAAPDVDLAAHSARWSPWRSYAALHLWAGSAD